MALPIQTLESVAEELKVTTDTLREWSKRNGFPAVPVTQKCWFVDVEDLREWLQSQRGKSKPNGRTLDDLGKSGAGTERQEADLLPREPSGRGRQSKKGGGGESIELYPRPTVLRRNVR